MHADSTRVPHMGVVYTPSRMYANVAYICTYTRRHKSMRYLSSRTNQLIKNSFFTHIRIVLVEIFSAVGRQSSVTEKLLR